jgi:hypothetical protein
MVYPKITVGLKFLLFYSNPKGVKRNFKLVSVQKWNIPFKIGFLFTGMAKSKKER